MKFSAVVFCFILYLAVLKSAKGGASNVSVGQCAPTNEVISREIVYIRNEAKAKSEDQPWYKKFWNWITASTPEGEVVKVTKTYPPNRPSRQCNITCVQFVDLSRDGNGGNGVITDGGVGYQFVKIELTSQPGKEIRSNVTISGVCPLDSWSSPDRRQRTPVVPPQPNITDVRYGWDVSQLNSTRIEQPLPPGLSLAQNDSILIDVWKAYAEYPSYYNTSIPIGAPNRTSENLNLNHGVQYGLPAYNYSRF